MLIPVIVFWLGVFGYIPFHFRKCAPVRDFLIGFTMVWRSTARASDQESDLRSKVEDTVAFDNGVITAVLSLVVAIVVALLFAAYTIYLAS